MFLFKDKKIVINLCMKSLHIWAYDHRQVKQNIVGPHTRLGMSVTTQGGSGRQYVTGPGRNISKYRFVVLSVYRFMET